MGQIIGYSKFKSKKGADCCVLRVMVPCGLRDNEYGRYGHTIQEVFVPDEMHSQITEEVILREVTVDYEFYNGKAYPRSIVIE